MAKTKWIVPAVALMLCAVSLIGAGYAAYTATLRDTETVTVDNNYTTLSIGTHEIGANIFIEYDSETPVTDGVEGTTTYTAKAPAQPITLLTFSVESDRVGTVDTVESITLTSIAFNPSPTKLTTYFETCTIAVYDSEGNQVTTLTAGEDYTVKLTLGSPVQDVTTKPDAQVSVTYVITVTDSVTNA